MATIQFHPGRPPKFSPELCNDIIKSVSECLPLKICAEENGIHYDTLRTWINQGIDDILDNKWTEKAQFAVAMKKEVANSMRDLLSTIRIGDAGWQGSAWVLERRWWKYWSNKTADIDFNERLSALEEKQKLNQGDTTDGKVNSNEKKENPKE